MLLVHSKLAMLSNICKIANQQSIAQLFSQQLNSKFQFIDLLEIKSHSLKFIRILMKLSREIAAIFML